MNRSQKKKMIVIHAIGTMGDILPMLGIGAYFKERGHHIVFLGNELFEDRIKSFGFEFIMVNRESHFTATYVSPGRWSESRCQSHFPDFHIPAMEPSYRAIKRLYDEGFDLFVIFMTTITGPRMVCDDLGIPYAQLEVSPWLVPSNEIPNFPFIEQVDTGRWPHVMPHIRKITHKQVMDRWVHPLINPLRSRLNVPEWSDDDVPQQSDSKCLIGLFPQWLRPVPGDWPEHLFLAGFPRFEIESAETPAVVTDFLGKNATPIVFTSGSYYPPTDNAIDNARTLCKKLNKPGIYVSRSATADHYYVEENFLVVRFAPFSELFPNAGLVVHHGGIGTCAQAFAAGVPQLICPLSFDQPDNAYWAWKLGVANAFDSEEILSPESVSSIKHLLGSHTVAGKLKYLQKRTLEEDAINRACTHMEMFF